MRCRLFPVLGFKTGFFTVHGVCLVFWGRKEGVGGAAPFDVRLTDNMNRSGYFSKRRFSMVLLPVPLGPEMTIGRGFFSIVGDMVKLRCGLFARKFEERGRRYETVEGKGWRYVVGRNKDA
jgi:hypothetical protein